MPLPWDREALVAGADPRPSEHARAFANKKGRPKHLASVSLEISDGWKQALGDISDETLTENFSDVLDKRRLKALMTRRDELLAAARAR